MGLTITLTGLGPIGMPQVIARLLEGYGTTGALVILAGIALHSFIGASLLRPLSEANDKVEVTPHLARAKPLSRSFLFVQNQPRLFHFPRDFGRGTARWHPAVERARRCRREGTRLKLRPNTRRGGTPRSFSETRCRRVFEGREYRSRGSFHRRGPSDRSGPAARRNLAEGRQEKFTFKNIAESRPRPSQGRSLPRHHFG